MITIKKVKAKVATALKVLSGINTVRSFLLMMIPLPVLSSITGYFLKLSWPLMLCLVEAGIIVSLLIIIYSIQKNKLQKLPSFEFADLEFTTLFWQQELGPIEEIKKKYMAQGQYNLSGKQVKEYQSRLLDLLLKREKHEKIVRALDLTDHPENLLHSSRDGYHEKNKDFISGGGEIKRILIIKQENLKDMDFCKNLLKVIDKNLTLRVSIGLYFRHLNMERPSHNQDVIIYGSCAAIIEEQSLTGDSGVSRISFSAVEVHERKEIFNGFHWETTIMYLTTFVNYMKRTEKEPFSYDSLCKELELVSEAV